MNWTAATAEAEALRGIHATKNPAIIAAALGLQAGWTPNWERVAESANYMDEPVEAV